MRQVTLDCLVDRLGDGARVVQNHLLNEGQDEVDKLRGSQYVKELLDESLLDRLRDLVDNKG